MRKRPAGNLVYSGHQKSLLKILISSVPLLLVGNGALATEFSGFAGVAGRYYPDDATFPEQDGSGFSLALEGEVRHKWDNDFSVFTFVPFYRYDQVDDERTHGDIRQLDVLSNLGDWEYQLGISKVFWGVAESSHLVDVINQTDAVEAFDREEKLGQPMARLSRFYDAGSISVFVLPYFRERTFPGTKGRLRFGLEVDTDNVLYESEDEQQHIDYALRLQHMWDALDIGVSWFDGTSRDPYFLPDGESAKLLQYYPLMKQAGLDLQYTGAEWLWKLEVINRHTEIEDFTAGVGGFEYTLPNVGGSRVELGLLAEYHNDSRGESPYAPFQNDLFLGTRIVLNNGASDTECLIGGYVDLDNQTKSGFLEYSSRLSGDFKLVVEGQAFVDVDETDTLYDLRADSYLEVQLEYYF